MRQKPRMREGSRARGRDKRVKGRIGRKRDLTIDVFMDYSSEAAWITRRKLTIDVQYSIYVQCLEKIFRPGFRHILL